MKIVEVRTIKQEEERLKREALYAEPLEACVLCGEMTDVPVSMNINKRKCYVPGVGQLCRKCCEEVYGSTDLRFLVE